MIPRGHVESSSSAAGAKHLTEDIVLDQRPLRLVVDELYAGVELEMQSPPPQSSR